MVVITNPDACVAGQTYRECPTTAFDADNYYFLQNADVTDDYIESENTPFIVQVSPGAVFKRYANSVYINNSSPDTSGGSTSAMWGTYLATTSGTIKAGIGITSYDSEDGELLIKMYRNSDVGGWTTLTTLYACYDIYVSTIITFLPWDGSKHLTLFDYTVYNGTLEKFKYSMSYNYTDSHFSGIIYNNVLTLSVDRKSKILYEYLQCTSGLPESCRASIYADFDYEVL